MTVMQKKNTKWTQQGNAAVMWLLFLLVLILGFAGGWLVAKRLILADPTQRGAPGPWGEVHYIDSFIEMPESLVKATTVPNEPTRWFVEAVSPLNLKLALQACELPTQQITRLLDTAVPLDNGAGYVLQPPDELVLGLGADERARLYYWLASFPQNMAYAGPYRFDASTPKDWLEDSCLPPDVIDLVRPLIYRHGELWLFSDLNLVLRHYPDPKIYARMFRVLSRVAILLAHVRVRPDDKAGALANYWGWPDRVDAVRVRIKAFQATGSIQNVPMGLLLPYFARDRLYRFQNKEDPETATCHYSAMNFFNDAPDLRFTNTIEIIRSLKEDYVEVREAFQLGDIVQFMQNGSNVVHSCNYVADNIVFTKNGGMMVQPWVLTKLDDLAAFYSYPKPITVRVMRRKDCLKHFKQ